MKKENLFVSTYNKENYINIKEDLNIYDECLFSYLDILKEKEVEVLSKVETNCKCCESVNFNTYYEVCDKCEGKGLLMVNGNEIICNHCHGKKKIVKNKCPLCEGSGRVIKQGLVKAKLNRSLIDGSVLVLEGKGKKENNISGDLHIRVRINDLDNFYVNENDVYDRRMIDFSKDDIAKGTLKSIETITGFYKVKSSGEVTNEVVKIDNQGLNGGDFYVCLNNELVPIKGKDVYKNIIINKDMLGFYLSEDELKSDRKCLNVYYFKNINDTGYQYIELEDVHNFKIVKLKNKGLNGKYGGDRGDLYLRVYFDDFFKVVEDKLYSIPIKLTKYEINEGKKILEFNKTKINLNFDKNINEEKQVIVKEYGFMLGKDVFDQVIFNINPFNYNVYRVSVKANRKDKIIYLKDYKRFFYEKVSLFNDGLKVIVHNKKDNIVFDCEGNKVIVRIVR